MQKRQKVDVITDVKVQNNDGGDLTAPLEDTILSVLMQSLLWKEKTLKQERYDGSSYCFSN